MAKSKKAAASPSPTSPTEAKTPVETAPATAAPTPAAAASEAVKAPKAGGKKKAAPKAAAKAPASTPAVPAIDTSLAAATAARLVGAKLAPGAVASLEAKKETSAFKQMKENVANPHSGGLNNLLNSSAGPASRKSNLPFGGSGKQTGRNQTFGSDATRTNLPRRTGG